MGMTFEALTGVLGLNSRPWKAGLAEGRAALADFRTQAAKAFKGVSDSARVASNGINTMVKAATAGLAAIGATSYALVKLASNAEEASSKFGFVFGKAADSTRKKLDEFSKAAGRSRYELREMAANVGALLGPMGLSAELTSKMSTGFAELAVDLSSFFNVTESEAMGAFQSALAGQSEPMRRFGVMLTEETVKAKAFELGLMKSTKDALTPAARAQAVYAITLERTTTAQGDAIRTGNSYANTMRRVRGQIMDSATEMGEALLPAGVEVLRIVGELSDKFFVATGGLEEWVKANVAAAGVRDAYEQLEAVVIRLYDASVRLWDVSAGLRDRLGEVKDRATSLLAPLKDMFDRLPQWVQDLLLVGGALTGIGGGLSLLGGGIPIIGGLFTAVGALLNPVAILRGLFAFLWPLITAVAGVFGLLSVKVLLVVGAVAAVSAGIVWLTLKLKEIADGSAVFQAALLAIKLAGQQLWDNLKGFGQFIANVFNAWLEKNADTILRLRIKFEELGAKLRDFTEGVLNAIVLGIAKLTGGLANASGDMTAWGTAAAMMEAALDGVLYAVEALADALSGDFRRASVIGLKAIDGILDGLIAMRKAAGKEVPEALANASRGLKSLIVWKEGEISRADEAKNKEIADAQAKRDAADGEGVVSIGDVAAPMGEPAFNPLVPGSAPPASLDGGPAAPVDLLGGGSGDFETAGLAAPAAEATGEVLGGTAEGVKEAVAAEVPEVVRAALEPAKSEWRLAVEAWGKDLAPFVKDQAKKVGGLIQQAFDNGATREQKKQIIAIRDAYLQMLRDAGKATGPARDEMLKLAEAMSQELAGAIEHVNAGQKGLFQGMAAGAEKAGDAVVDAANKMGEVADKTVDNTESRARRMVSGVMDAAGAAMSAIQNLSGTVIAGTVNIASLSPVQQLAAKLGMAQSDLFQLQTNRKTLGSSYGFGGASISRQGNAMAAIDRRIQELMLSIVAMQAERDRLQAATPMAMGGIVTRPTFALVGERGPEAVIPLGRGGGRAGAGIGGGNTINMHFNQEVTPERARALVDAVEREVTRRGIGPRSLRASRQTPLNSRNR